MRFRCVFLLFFTLCSIISIAQDSMPATLVVCEAGYDATPILPETLPSITDSKARNTAATLNFIITYDANFPAAAKPAFEAAANIWAKYLVSSVPIRIAAKWEALSGTTLAESGATKIYRNFLGAPYQNVWYPVPLAESLAGRDLNNGGDDIIVDLNNKFNWSYATDGKAVAGKYDLTSVVLHELAHGLGFFGSYLLNTNNTQQVQWGQMNSASIFDINVIDGSNRLLTNTSIFGNPSADLKTALTNGSVYYDLRAPNIASPKLYAPNPFVNGTSISHFDETTYPYGNANSLMSPKVLAGEVVQTPGDILLNIFSEMGWLIHNVTVALANENTKPQVYPIAIYPNPSAESINIAIPDNGKVKDVNIAIFNQNGQLVYSLQEKDINSKAYSIAINEWLVGIYYLQVRTNDEQTFLRFVKN